MYGQNALKSLVRPGMVPGGNANMITAQNNNFMNHMIPPHYDYNTEMMKHGGFQPSQLPNIMGVNK
jgi:hypothetical protein